MKRLLSVFLILICISTFIGCGTIPQKETWSTYTKEEAYQIFPKYAEKVKEILTDTGMNYVVDEEKSRCYEEYGCVFFETYLEIENKYELYFFSRYDTENPRQSDYGCYVYYTFNSVEEAHIDERFYQIFYDINYFCTGGIATFKSADMFKDTFDRAYAEFVNGKVPAGADTNVSHIDWIDIEANISYRTELSKYRCKLGFADFLSDDFVENKLK